MALPVRTDQEPPSTAYTQLFAYDGSSQLEYIGWAKSLQPTHSYVVGVNLTNIVDSSNTATVTATAHGLTTGQRVTVAGASDTDLNGTYVITVTSADAFTFTSASVTDATYTDDTLVITTTAPRTNASCWAIQKLVYSSTLQTESHWAEGTSAEVKAWDSRATYAYQ